MELLERARQWASHDPDPATASALSADIEAAERGDEEAAARVGAAMNGPLQFGTAGLRGVVGPGESRMNLAVVIRATAGLCEVVKRHATGTPTLVVGCDARYGSSEFATAACRVASAAGVRVLALPQANPTPLTSFAVRHYGADAGVMVTASHNPAPDNGYKVYLGGSVVTGDGQGVQIVPPFDAEIGNVPLSQWGPTLSGGVFDSALRHSIAQEVVQSAYKIIEGKGATNYAIGLSAANIAGAVLRDEQRVLTIATLLEDWEGISDVVMAAPTIVGRDGAGRVLNPPLTLNERDGLTASAERLRKVARDLGF